MTTTDTAANSSNLGEPRPEQGQWERIRKQPENYRGANLPNYEECTHTFAWDQARALLDGLPGGGLNIAYEAIDRHLKAGSPKSLAAQPNLGSIPWPFTRRI